MTQLIIPRTLYTHPYPFIKTLDWEEDEGGVAAVARWRPGIVPRQHPCGVAHGVGTQDLDLVDIYTPPKGQKSYYQPRAIYTRCWQDPDGLAFGNTRLRWCTLRTFAQLARGYRLEYVLDPEHAADYLECLLARHQGIPQR